jgi:hypothetical protein
MCSYKLNLVDFPGGFVLPERAVLQRPVELYGARAGAIVNAAAAVPAFVRMQYYRRLAFNGIGDINIYLADFHAVIAPVADFFVKSYRAVRCGGIRQCYYFLFSHFLLQKSVG